jgi:glycosyltransferase involved in cell wall biosynthesis
MTIEPRVAIVHEWLVNYAGSERVTEQLLRMYPGADLFAVVDFLSDSERTAFLGGRRARTTFIQNLPGARKHFRAYLPLMPMAVEQHDLSAYDIVISSSHAVAKGVLTGANQLHISYVHSPIRYAWDLQHQYLEEAGLTQGLKASAAKAILHYMRLWDQRTAHGVDHFVANSQFIARRIAKTYGRKAQVIYPPVDIQAFTPTEAKDDFYLTASRFVPYKKVPLIVQAFRAMPTRQLVVIGEGPEFARAKALAAGAPNVKLLGFQPAEELRQYMQRARAFVFAAEEDFGIVPVEAQACGTPVIAYARGGALETVRGLGSAPDATGLFFDAQTSAAIVDAVERFEAHAQRFHAAACRANAECFSIQRFTDEMRALVDAAWRDHLAGPAGARSASRAQPGSSRNLHSE